MTYTFKLSRRLSLSHWSPVWALIALLAGCSSSDLTTTGPDAQLAEVWAGSTESIKGGSNPGKGRGHNRDSSQTLVSIAISPDPTSVPATGTTRFIATGLLSDGSKVNPRVTWSATGGRIDSTGFYVAGSVPGKYRVLAKTLYTDLADTGAVTVTTEGPSVTAVTISPSSVSLQSGATQRFTASAKLSDGTSQSTNITYQATGGTIDANGLYTAGSTAGAYRVIAASSGKADTAFATIMGSGTTTVAGCPASGYVRLVNVGSVSQLNAALAAAQPGDQIRLAPGTYAYANGAAIVLNRSGTAANRITVCGPRTAITTGGIWRVDYPTKYWHLRGFKIHGNGAAFTGVWDLGGGRQIYDSLEITGTTQEGLIIKGATAPNAPSIGNEVRYNYIHDTGISTNNFGECVYIGDGNDPSKVVDSTWIHHNELINCRAEGIELKAGTRFALVEFNRIINAGHGRVVGSDAPIEVRASYNRIFDNVIDLSPRYSIEMFADDPKGGMNNTFRRNRASRAGNNRMLGMGTNDGSSLTGNTWGCDNVPVDPMVLGLTCSP
jgi:hypothetical protein